MTNSTISIRQLLTYIQFTIEDENGRTICFLYTEIVRKELSLKFHVFRKSTNSDDYVYYLSGHRAIINPHTDEGGGEYPPP